MSTVEFGNSLDPGEELDDLLDFPVDDCLEEGETVEDWDIANEQCLGPIPLDMLMAPPTKSNEELNSSILIPKPVAPIAGAPEQKQQLLEHVHSSNTIPVRSRSKRARHSGINPRLFAAHEQNSNARRSKESRESSLQKPVAMDLMRNSPEKDDNVSDPACETASKACPAVVKKCAHCQATKTPQWRRGPLGAMTLCNACGVSYRTGRLFPEYRPAASPTFISSQHSNSHRKVVGMRLKKRLKFKIKIPRVPADTSSSLQIARTPKPVDTPCSLVPRLIPGLSEQTHLAKNVHINGFPEQKQVDEHVDTYSTTRIRLQIAGTHKHVDSPCSFVPRLVAGAPEQKHPGKHVDTSCSLIPPPSKVSQARKQKQHIERKQLAKHDDDDDTYRPPNKLAKKVQQESRGESSLKPESRQAGGKPPSLPCTKVRIIINVGKKCAHCQSTRIPQCGEGPLGRGMLCNACEVRYRSGRLLPQHRPEASP